MTLSRSEYLVSSNCRVQADALLEVKPSKSHGFVIVPADARGFDHFQERSGDRRGCRGQRSCRVLDSHGGRDWDRQQRWRRPRSGNHGRRLRLLQYQPAAPGPGHRQSYPRLREDPALSRHYSRLRKYLITLSD